MDSNNGTCLENGTKKSNDESSSFEDAMALTGFGKFNIWILIVSGFCLITVITETTGMAFILPAAQCDLDVSLGQKGLLTAVSFLGIMCSSHLWGFLADTQGRRTVLFWSLISAFVVTVVSSFATSLWLFVLLRFLNGFLIAAPSATIYVYLGEFHVDRTRARMLTLCASLITLGSVYLPATSWLIIPMEWQLYMSWLGVVYKPWRLLVIAFGIPGILCFFCLYITPESPKYLMGQGETEKALEVLKTVYRWNTGNDRNSFPVKCLKKSDTDITISFPSENKSLLSVLKFIWSQTGPIFLPPYAIKTFMLCFIQFGSFFISAGLYLWYPAILNKMINLMADNTDPRFSICKLFDTIELENIIFENTTSSIIEDTGIACDDTVNIEVFQVTLVMSAVIAIVYGSCAAIMTWVGNKVILIFVLLVSAVSGMIIESVDSPLLVMILLLTLLLCCIAIGVTNTFTVDIYPTHYRGMAMSMSLMVGRFGAITGTNVAGYMLEYLCFYMFYLFGAILFVCAAIAYMLPSGTKKTQSSDL